MTPINYREDITQEGLNFAHDVCQAVADRDELSELLSMYDVSDFTGGSGNRIVCEFPDEFITAGGRYFDEQHHDTFYVLKACERPDLQNYKEVQIWKQANDGESADLFAPIHAWDGAYRWVLMKRVTPVTPYEGDTAYHPLLGSGQEHYYEPDAVEWIEEELEKEGWEIVDVEENTAFHEEQEYLCLMDYGGVSPIDDEIDLPKWVIHDT